MKIGMLNDLKSQIQIPKNHSVSTINLASRHRKLTDRRKVDFPVDFMLGLAPPLLDRFFCFSILCGTLTIGTFLKLFRSMYLHNLCLF
jgi:hypothetical protein